MSNYSTQLQLNNEILNENNIDLQNLIDQANALPDVVNIDEELNTQDGLIEQIQAALVGKVAGSGGSGEDPFKISQSFTYTVDSIDGAQYGFAINDNGYYESMNKGVNSSYAICRVNLNIKENCDIVFDVINYAKSRFDYAIFGNLDTTLTLSSTEDSASKIKESFKDRQSDSIVKVTYSNVAIGSHFIDVKFIKDSTQSKNYDSVQFKIPKSDEIFSQATLDKLFAADPDFSPENIKSGVNIFGVVGTLDNPDDLITRNLSTYTNNRVSNIGAGAFYGYNSLVSVDFPNCINIGGMHFPGAGGFNGAFAYCGALKTVSFPACTTIGSYAFYSCFNLTTVSFPACTTIDNCAFEYCNSLTTVSFPVCTSIGSSAFYYCFSLTTMSFPACITIGEDAFADCKSLTTVSFPACTIIGKDAFNGCYNLTTISFPICTSINKYAFGFCSNLTTASFPVCTTIGEDAFYCCYSLITTSFPACTTISDGAFSSCSSLTTASFPACITIGEDAFFCCYNLKSLYLTNLSVCTLSNSNAFTSTPIGGYSTSAGTYGSIYVPASLLKAYQTATNWTYFSSRFVALELSGGAE